MSDGIPQTDLPPTGRQILVAFNRIAGAGGRESRVEQLLQALRQAGFDATVCPDEQTLLELTTRLNHQLRGVIAAGGDGTVSWVANRVPASTPLACFPLGTENLLARYLGHAADPQAVVQLFQQGCSLSLDAGEANGRLFSLMAGCGFDAEVVEQLHRNRRGNIRHWSYIKPMLDTLRTYAYPRLSVQVALPQGGEETIECRWAFVVNVPRYAFGLQIDPRASPSDGLLNVVTFRDGSLWSGLNYLAAVAWNARRPRRCLLSSGDSGADRRGAAGQVSARRRPRRGAAGGDSLPVGTAARAGVAGTARHPGN